MRLQASLEPTPVNPLVRCLVGPSHFHSVGVSGPSQSVRRDLWPCWHLIRVMRQDDLTKRTYLPTYPSHLPPHLPIYILIVFFPTFIFPKCIFPNCIIPKCIFPKYIFPKCIFRSVPDLRILRLKLCEFISEEDYCSPASLDFKHLIISAKCCQICRLQFYVTFNLGTIQMSHWS